jgi:hypothetical protein
MADNPNSRSYRPADQRWPSQTAPAAAGSRDGGNDPLAELARLIGQTDPFAELNQHAPPRGSAAAGARPAPARPAPVATPPRPAVQPTPATPEPSYPSDHYGSPLQFGGKGFDRGYPEPQQEQFQPAYDPAIYGTPPQQQAAPGYPQEGYYDDHAHSPQGEETYEEDYAEERPRRSFKLILAGVALVVLGTSGVLGYRAIFSNNSSGPPPVIKANTTPSKIAAAPSAEASNKQIYDRVGDASQGERMVSREEKPVEVKDTSRPSSRPAYPGMPTTSSAQDTTMASASPPLPTDPGGPPSSAEPKKIRTVTIRPDSGTGTTSAARPIGAQPQPAPRATAAMPLDSVNGPPAASRAAPNAAAPQGNAPLSLSPQAASAEASARPAFPPPPRPAAAPAVPTRVAAVPPATEAASGAYTVQISSQRSENEAHASFRSLQTKFPSLLGDRQAIVRRADLGEKGVYYRAMVGPFASVDQAAQFCGSLKSAGGQCVVQRN